MFKNLEVIATSIEDVKNICENGGDRIELISAFPLGGLTPSYALVKEAQKITTKPIQAMIRPHSYSFHYSKSDLEIMKQDILFMKEQNVNGVVLGILDESGKIDQEALDYLLPFCDGLEVTFHKAFDELEDQLEGLEILKQYKQITRILTSGGTGNIVDNLDKIAKLQQNSGHITILLGGGVKFANIEEIIDKVQPIEVHVGTTVRENSAVEKDVSAELVHKFKELCI